MNEKKKMDITWMLKRIAIICFYRDGQFKILQNVDLTTNGLLPINFCIRYSHPSHQTHRIHVSCGEAALLQHLEHYRTYLHQAFKKCAEKHNIENPASY